MRRTGTGAAARGRSHAAGRACAARRRRGRARRAQAWARVQEEQRRGRSTATNLPTHGAGERAPDPHPAVLEDELELYEVELRRLLAHNHALVEELEVLSREIQGGSW